MSIMSSSTATTQQDVPVAAGTTLSHLTLPSGKLGITLKGFPPVVTAVTPDSPLAGEVLPGMTIDQLIIPGSPPFTLASGGFTDLNVTKRLMENSHVEGRVLVLKYAAIPNHPQQRGAGDWFDLQSFTGFWGIGRMFHNNKKEYQQHPTTQTTVTTTTTVYHDDQPSAPPGKAPPT